MPVPFSRFLPFALLLALVGTGCGRELAETPIERPVLAADLLQIAEDAGERTGAVSEPGELRVRTRIPEDSVLHLWSRAAPRRPGEKVEAAVIFLVEVGGEQLFRRRVVPGPHGERVVAEVPIVPGDTEVVLRIDCPEPDVACGYWQRATVEERVETPRQRARGGPNLLFVVVDTWRADHLSLYGHTRPTTPRLDALAEEALVFDNAIAPCSWTAPSVASLLTGLYPLQHGVIHGEPLGHRSTTLAETLQEAGFTTLAVSSNPLIDPNRGYRQGFERFHHIPWERADEVNRLFFDWLPEVEGLRWFAYLHYIDPHDPYDAPPPFGDRFFEPGPDGEPYDGVFADRRTALDVFEEVNFGLPREHAFGPRDVAHLEAAYDGEILYWDHHFGEVVDRLRASGLLDRTVLVVTSDHGEEFYEHGKFKHGHHLYDESIRVPLLMRAPGLDPGRRRVPVEIRGAARAALQLLRMAESPPRPEDLLLATEEDRRIAFSHTKHQPKPGIPRRTVVTSARDGEWKLVRWLGEERSELYRLTADPGEQHNLIDAHPEVAARYQRLLDLWLETAPREAVDATESPPMDPELLEQLRALGYVQ